MKKDNNNINVSKEANNGANSKSITNSSDPNFFLDNKVEGSCNHDLYNRFQTLLLQKKCKQQDLADYCGLDKAYISRVVHGIYIPILRIKLKIAEFFGVDSRLIWQEDEE